MTKEVYSYGVFTATTPTGRCCATVRDFVVLARTDAPFTIQWCAIGDPSDWPTPNTDDARSKQSGAQIFPNNFGVVTAISGNDFFGYVFQERAITRMSYIGGDVVFTFDTFEEGRGCAFYNRIVRLDDTVFFESEFGRHTLTDGQITDIGLGITDKTYPPS